MDHYAPHTGAQFEGYYSKFDLPSGANLTLVMSSVPGAGERPHLVSFSYISKDAEYFQRELSVERIDMVKTSSADVSFEVRAAGIGSMTVAPDNATTYSIKHDDFSFTAKTTSHQPWSSTTDTPEGKLVHLPLPLHWYVHSLGSACSFELNIPSCPFLSADDRSGSAMVHQEKNWANSFPSAHVWIQATDDQPLASAPASGGDASKSTTSHSFSPQHRSICIAGGKLLGTEAYMVGYRSTTHPSCSSSSSASRSVFELDFRPPQALRLWSRSPTLAVKPDFANRTFTLSARSWRRRIDVRASAPENTFFPLSAPFSEGHRDNILAESFKAVINVRVYEWKWGSRWWNPMGWWVGSKGDGDPAVGRWELAEEAEFQNGSLEFGGEYYGFAGSKTRRGR